MPVLAALSGNPFINLQHYNEVTRCATSATSRLAFSFIPRVLILSSDQFLTVLYFVMAATQAGKKRCIGDECNNEVGTLQCPTCLKLGKESTFCSQDCFKRSWVGFLVPSQGTCINKHGMELRLLTSRPITNKSTNLTVSPL